MPISAWLHYDPEMHQTKKGNQWYFGMKIHVGADSQSKVMHSVVTPANVADCKVLGDLLHGKEGRVYGDQAYKSQGEVIRRVAPKAKDFTNRQCKWKHYLDEAIRAKNRNKSRIRARVEHSIGVMKRVFEFTKVRYRGLAKNANRVFVTPRWPTFFSSDIRSWEQSVRSRKAQRDSLDFASKSRENRSRSRILVMTWSTSPGFHRVVGPSYALGPIARQPQLCRRALWASSATARNKDRPFGAAVRPRASGVHN